jgi:hypothetical protein
MEKSVDPLASARVSNVIDFEERKAEMIGAEVRIESMVPTAETEPTQFWVGGIAKHGKVHIRLEVSKLSVDATRAFAKTLLMLADTAEKQTAEEAP